MQSDTQIGDGEPKKMNKKSQKIVEVNKQGSNISLSLVVSVLCLVCLTICAYNSWRSTTLEYRINILEDRLSMLEGDSVKNYDVLVERFRREVENRFKQRVTRDLASSLYVGGLNRKARDAPECICPAGM